MVHTALQTKTPLAHAHCEVEQAKRSDSVNIGDGCSVSWVKGRISKNAARGQELPPPQMGSHHKQMVKDKLKAICTEDPAMYKYETWRQIFKYYYSRQKIEIGIQFHAPSALSPDERHIAEKGGHPQPIRTRRK